MVLHSLSIMHASPPKLDSFSYNITQIITTDLDRIPELARILEITSSKSFIFVEEKENKSDEIIWEIHDIREKRMIAMKYKEARFLC